MVASGALQNYVASCDPCVDGNGALALGDMDGIDAERLAELTETATLFRGDAGDDEVIDRLENALEWLAGRALEFRGVACVESSTVAVNAAAWYLDAELGRQPATETYLESRREIETDRQQAIVENMRAQTQAQVFFPKLPDNVTHLDMNLADDNGDPTKTMVPQA